MMRSKEALWAIGSSPLARGLLGGFTDDGTAIGIIPARAGFTSKGPRSRM